MQNWNDQIRKQLNNLPGFPPVPTGTPAGTPATPYEWILGNWIQECRVRPAAATFATLPATGNQVGDIRASLADQAWYIWDGAIWQPMAGGGGAVNSVTASAPLASSGGANPDLSFPSWPANAAGVLTNDGAGALSWSAASAPATVDVPATAQEILVAGDLVRFVNAAGSPRVQKADATNTDARLNAVGFAVAGAAAGAAVTVRIAGVADVPVALFDLPAPTPVNVGQRVFVSTTAGKVTLTAPSASGDIVQRVGVLVDGSGSPKVLVQIGDPTLL
jgi:hypothetical protein